MTVSSSSNDDMMQEWFIEKLSDAKTTLQQFPKLNEIFNNLEGFEEKHHTVRQNIFIDGVFPTVQGHPKTHALQPLQDIEDALIHLNYDHWRPSQKTELSARIISEDRHANLSVFTELQIAHKMINRIELKNIEVYPETQDENISDLKIMLDDFTINFEITNLNIGKSEEKIQEIFDAVAKYLCQKITERKYFFQIYVNPFELSIDENGHIDVKKSIEYLNNEIDRFHLDLLQGYDGYFTFSKVEYVLKYRDKYPKEIFDMTEREILQNLNNEPLSTWRSEISSELSINSPIKGLIGNHFSKDAESLVEIHSDDNMSQVYRRIARTAFLDHILRRVKEKVESNQLNNDTANVVVVQGYHWLFSLSGYMKSEFEPIRKKIMDYLNEKKSKILSGVLIFSSDFDKAIFIPNPYCLKEKMLSEEHIKKLQLKLEPDNDF